MHTPTQSAQVLLQDELVTVNVMDDSEYLPKAIWPGIIVA